MASKFVVIDIETGGTSAEKHAILSLSFRFLDSAMKEVFHYYTLVKDYPHYEVTPEALAINGLDIKEVKARGKSLTEIYWELQSTMKNLAIRPLTKLYIAGHRVGFDIGFLTRDTPLKSFLMEHTHRSKYGEFLTLDTAKILETAHILGTIPLAVDSLKKLANHYGVNSEGNHHAGKDTQMVSEIIEAMKQGPRLV